MLRTLASRAFRFSLAALLAVAALAAAPALRAQDEDLFGGDDKPAAAHGDAKNAAGGEEDKAGEEAVPGTYDAARGDLAARLDDLITTLSEANRTYSERVNKLLDQGEQELKRVREIAGSVQQQVSDAVDAVRALAETVKEFLLLSEDDMTSLVDDLSTSVLGDQLKGMVDQRAGTLTDDQKKELKNAVDTTIVPALADMLKGGIKAAYRFRLPRLPEKEARRGGEQKNAAGGKERGRGKADLLVPKERQKEEEDIDRLFEDLFGDENAKKTPGEKPAETPKKAAPEKKAAETPKKAAPDKQPAGSPKKETATRERKPAEPAKKPAPEKKPVEKKADKAREPKAAAGPKPTGKKTAGGNTELDVNCPVSGEPAVREVFLELNGRKVYFCCPGCVEEYRANPERYSQ